MLAAIMLAAGLGVLAPSPQHITAIISHAGNAHGSSTATVIPINSPHELALDAQGNLYVANTGTNAILVYNPALVQQTGRTITNGLSAPWGVAVDPYGNVFASSVGTPAITEYNATGGSVFSPFNVAGTFPTEITVDPLDDLYVVCQSSLTANAASSLRVFEKLGKLDFTGFNRPTSVALDGSDLIVSGIYGTPYFEALYADSLINAVNPIGTLLSYFSLASASASIDETAVAAPGNLWLSDTSDKRIIHTTVSGSPPYSATSLVVSNVFKQLGYVPTGVAVDQARQRVYVSDFSDNAIQVINMQTAAVEAVIK